MNSGLSKIVKWLTVVSLALVFSSTDAVWAQEAVTITTWNVEHLGTTGRGFGGGCGAGCLPKRSGDQLKKIAELIRNDLKADILALQEIGITEVQEGVSYSEQLDVIIAELGDGWHYYLPPVENIPTDKSNMFCALLWNENKVNLLDIFVMDVPDYDLAGGDIFDRKPVVGYFEALKNGEATNDFVIINVHLKSGQDYDENHLIAMTILEHGLSRSLKENEILESDRIILGDFNDNPYARTPGGKRKYTNALYEHMAFKSYTDMVTKDFHSTRMDSDLKSVIDHILVSRSAKKHVPMQKAEIFLPADDDKAVFADWRRTYSDHFPISFKIRIENEDDDVDFE